MSAPAAPTFYRTQLLACQAGLGKTRADIARRATRDIITGVAMAAGAVLVLLIWNASPKLGGFFAMLLGLLGTVLVILLPIFGVWSIVKGFYGFTKLGKQVRPAVCPQCALAHQLLTSVTSYGCACGLTLYLGTKEPLKKPCPGCGIAAGVSADFAAGKSFECMNCGATTTVQGSDWRLFGKTISCAKCGRSNSETAIFCAGCLAPLPQERRVEPDLNFLVAGNPADFNISKEGRRAVELLLAKNTAGTFADARARAAALDASTAAFTGDQFLKESYDALGWKDDGSVRGIELLAVQATTIATDGMTSQAAELLQTTDRVFARFLRSVMASLDQLVQDVALFDHLPSAYLPRRNELRELLRRTDPALAGPDVSVKLDYYITSTTPGELVKGKLKDPAQLERAIAALERSAAASTSA